MVIYIDRYIDKLITEMCSVAYGGANGIICIEIIIIT